MQNGSSLRWALTMELIDSEYTLPIRRLVYSDNNLMQLNLAENKSFPLKLDELTSTINGINLNMIDDAEAASFESFVKN